jgi:two-component system sensor histidine kinase DesK
VEPRACREPRNVRTVGAMKRRVRVPEPVARRVVPVVWSAVWLWPLLSPAAAIANGDVHPVVPAVAGLSAFAVLYVAVVIQAFAGPPHRPSPAHLVQLILLAALGIALTSAYVGSTAGWLAVMLYVGAAGSAALRGPAAFGWAVGSVAVLVAVALAHHQDGSTIGANAFNVLMSCGLVFVVKRMTEYISQLRETQAELARSAVEQERLRFSRDLHDLLGHTLSLVVVKAEVVRRLVPRDPQAAVSQAADIETIGRNALAEVRQAVTGYRARTLAAELDGARTALADAGIALTTRDEATPLPPGADALLGWTVREGVTNVIRHSRARHCEIVVHLAGGRTTLEIRDDGVGPAAASAGNGLRGLSERLAAAGGALRYERGATGGFEVVATLPAAERAVVAPT